MEKMVGEIIKKVDDITKKVGVYTGNLMQIVRIVNARQRIWRLIF